MDALILLSGAAVFIGGYFLFRKYCKKTSNVIGGGGSSISNDEKDHSRENQAS